MTHGVAMPAVTLNVLRLKTQRARRADHWAQVALRSIDRLELSEVFSPDDALSLRKVILTARANVIRESEWPTEYSDEDLDLETLEGG